MTPGGNSRERRLQREFERLYDAQNDLAIRHYRRNERHLRGMAEKIQFLQLPTLQERNHYIYSKGRGFDPTRAPASFKPLRRHDRRGGQIFTGMSKTDVVQAWGRPYRRDIAGEEKYQNERWIYRRGGKVKLVYFEGGVVNGWRTEEPPY